MSFKSFLYALGASSVVQSVLAATVTYDFTVGWVTRNPDNAQERPVIGINGQWPIPMISVTKGDRLIVKLHNDLGNQSTSLHFHGLYQNGTTEMDGTVGVTQCPLAPGSSMTYDFTVDQPGTYWYHSHERGQYPDGLRGPFIVHDPDNPYANQFEEETIVTLSDWYHDQMPPLLADFISYKNPTGAEPVPDAALMGDSQDFRATMEPGKTYFFRIINMGAFAGQYFWIEGHSMRIIEVDGIYTEPQEANMIYVTAAQRYGVLVTARNDTSANFPIVGSMDTDLFDTLPPTLNYNITGWAVYDPQKPLPEAKLVDEFDFYDDYNLVPQDGEPLYQNVDRSVNITMKMDNLGDGANYAFMNDVTWVPPKTPVLYSVLTSGEFATDATIYGPNTNAFILAENEVVEIIFNNADPGRHPFHLHGHAFQVAYRSDDDAGNYDPTVAPESSFKKTPMRRDTVMVHPNGNFVLRFRSDNPGVWLYHCHIEWHVASGLVATFIESPLTLQSRMNGTPTRNPLPADHLAVCASASPNPLPTMGNAVGNTGVEMLNLAGANTSPAPLPAGFTARGIVALVFSCISAFIGMVIIAWYGAKPISSQEQHAIARRIKEAKIVEKKEQQRQARHYAVGDGAAADDIRPAVNTTS